jgi:enoyl-CoA hydratase/carnithine racemase
MTYRGFATLELIELPDRVVATLNRPETRNAIDLAMVEELHAVCELVERGQHALLITGAGGTFAAGADIAQLQCSTVTARTRSPTTLPRRSCSTRRTNATG